MILPLKADRLPIRDIAPEVPGATGSKLVIKTGFVFEKIPNSVPQVSAVAADKAARYIK